MNQLNYFNLKYYLLITLLIIYNYKRFDLYT